MGNSEWQIIESFNKLSFERLVELPDIIKTNSQFVCCDDIEKTDIYWLSYVYFWYQKYQRVSWWYLFLNEWMQWTSEKINIINERVYISDIRYTPI